MVSGGRGHVSQRPRGATGDALLFFEPQLDPAILRLRQDRQGRWSKALSAIYDAHADMALEVQNLMQKELQDQIVAHGSRPQRQTHELENALVDDRLVSITFQGFSVDANRLNEIPEVKLYWERLEFGEAARPGGMFGRRVRAVFIGAGGDVHMPQRERFGMDLHMPFREVPRGGIGFLITGKIPPYAYIRGGIARWRGLGKSHQYDRYKAAFNQHGLGDLLR